MSSGYASITDSLQEFIDSDEGMRLILESDGGALYNEMYKTGRKLKKNILEAYLDLIDTPGARHVNRDAIHVSKPEHIGLKSYKIYVDISDPSLYRPSLYPSYYSEGAYNIITLFNEGYCTSTPVYGYWKYADRAIIASRVYRPHIGFIEQAIEDLSMDYGGDFDNSGDDFGDDDYE